MKKLFNTLSALTIITFCISSCTPEPTPEPKANFHIVNMYADTASINTCSSSDGGLNGSVFDFYIEMDSTVGYSVMPKLRYGGVFENGNIYGPFVHSFPQFTYDFIDNEIEHSECIRFGTTNWIDVTYEIQDADGHYSEPATLRINKPSGAN